MINVIYFLEKMLQQSTDTVDLRMFPVSVPRSGSSTTTGTLIFCLELSIPLIKYSIP